MEGYWEVRGGLSKSKIFVFVLVRVVFDWIGYFRLSWGLGYGDEEGRRLVLS